jgi:hypothetical protein
MTEQNLKNITCGDFVALPVSEQRAFILGVANGRGMVSGLFQAYAGAAQNFAETEDQKPTIAENFATILGMVQPVLDVDTQSLLNGVLAAARKPEPKDEFVISALASVHLDIVKAISADSEQNGG